MASNQRFTPDWASAPGDTIVDILEEREFSLSEFAQRMGATVNSVDDLIEGRSTITIAIARQLERVLGASVEFWMSRDFQYREDIARIHKADEEWLADLPVGDMIKFGWLKAVPHPADEVTTCLRYFDVPTVRAWHEKYAKVQESAAFRTSPSFDARPAAVAAWLRQGEIEAEKIRCSRWNIEQFHECLSGIRSLTRKKEPTYFIPKLQQLCAECGVAVVIVRAPTGCRASGATRFISEEKALLMLSFRYLSDDHFWFTFFHEAAHLLLHSKTDLFLECAETPLTTEEQEANALAADILVPPGDISAMLALRVSTKNIVKFARYVGVSPGIIVGQLQHRRRIGHNQFNGLKRRYKWEECVIERS